jgi:hypothetical protein
MLTTPGRVEVLNLSVSQVLATLPLASICPNCKTAFKVDEAGFADIAKQVRDQQFQEELQNRLQLAENEKQSAVKLAEANLRNQLQGDLTKKDIELSSIKAAKEKEIAQIKALLDNAELQKQLSVTEAVQKIEKERDAFANEVKNKELEKANLESTLKQQFATELKTKDEIIKIKDEEIAFQFCGTSVSILRNFRSN